MSNVEDRLAARTDKQALEDIYQAGRARIEKSQRIEQGQASALMFAAMAYGDVLENNTLFQKASHAAKLFCIAAIFVIPNLLVIHVLLG